MFAPLIKAPKAKTVSQTVLSQASAPPQQTPTQSLFDPAQHVLASATDTGKQRVGGVDEIWRSPGEPLAADTERHWSARFGNDFSAVRIHTDAAAAASARALNANAYTVGTHIAFGPGQYQPARPAGMRLLAHELAHVVQQRGGGSAPPGPRQEQDAEAASRAVAAGEAPRVEAPSQVGIAAQLKDSTAPKAKPTPFEQLMKFYRFYMDRAGYLYRGAGGNRGRLVNPNGSHFVEMAFDYQFPVMVSVIAAGKSFEVSEYNFAADRFETRARHIEQIEYERELGVLERIVSALLTPPSLRPRAAALCPRVEASGRAVWQRVGVGQRGCGLGTWIGRGPRVRA